VAARGRPCTLSRRSSTRERFSNATLCSASARRTVCAASDRPTAVSVLPGTRWRRGRASRQRATCLRRPISSEVLRTQHGMRGPASSTRSLRRSIRRPQGRSMRRLGSCVPSGVWLLRMSAPSTYADPRVLGTWRRALLTRPPSGVCGTAEARTGHATARTVVGCGRGLHGDDGNEPPRRRASSPEEAVEAEAQGAAPPRLVHEPVVHGLEAGQGVMSSDMAKSTALGVKDVASARSAHGHSNALQNHGRLAGGVDAVADVSGREAQESLGCAATATSCAHNGLPGGARPRGRVLRHPRHFGDVRRVSDERRGGTAQQ
jgi:hypothetical protein